MSGTTHVERHACLPNMPTAHIMESDGHAQVRASIAEAPESGGHPRRHDWKIDINSTYLVDTDRTGDNIYDCCGRSSQHTQQNLRYSSQDQYLHTCRKRRGTLIHLVPGIITIYCRVYIARTPTVFFTVGY